MTGPIVVIFLIHLARTFSENQACQVSYRKIGCYNDLPSSRHFPNLLLNARHAHAQKNPGYSISWNVNKYKEFLPRFICDCAKAAIPNSYFSIQFYGECWTGQTSQEDFIKYRPSTSCVNSTFGSCQPNSTVCSGTQWSNMIYYITTAVPTKNTFVTSRTTPTQNNTPTTKVTTSPSTTKTLPATTETPPTTTEPTKTTSPPTSLTEAITQYPVLGCPEETDILIALDVSSSVKYEEFEGIKLLLAKFVEQFPVNKNGVHFSLIRYNHYIYVDFTFNDEAFHDVRALQKAITDVPFLGGATLTQKALEKAFALFSHDQYGARQNSRKVLVIVTDGYTYGGASTLRIPALELESHGVEIVTVGIGQRMNTEGLRIMSKNAIPLVNILTKTDLELREYLEMLTKITCKKLS